MFKVSYDNPYVYVHIPIHRAFNVLINTFAVVLLFIDNIGSNALPFGRSLSHAEV